MFEKIGTIWSKVDYLQEDTTYMDNPIVMTYVFCRVKMDKDSVWMFGPLIIKLPGQVQGRILKLAAQLLEAGNNVINKKFDKERNLKRWRDVFVVVLLLFLFVLTDLTDDVL